MYGGPEHPDRFLDKLTAGNPANLKPAGVKGYRS
jgi:hypothetical protein